MKFAGNVKSIEMADGIVTLCIDKIKQTEGISASTEDAEMILKTNLLSYLPEGDITPSKEIKFSIEESAGKEKGSKDIYGVVTKAMLNTDKTTTYNISRLTSSTDTLSVTLEVPSAYKYVFYKEYKISWLK